MAEEIESRHENDCVYSDLPVAADHLEQVALFFPDALLEEGGRLIDSHAHEKHENRGSDSEQEHVAPAETVVKEVGRDRGDEIAAGIAGLQKTGDDAACTRRNGLKRQGGSDAPLSSHRNAE